MGQEALKEAITLLQADYEKKIGQQHQPPKQPGLVVAEFMLSYNTDGESDDAKASDSGDDGKTSDSRDKIWSLVDDMNRTYQLQLLHEEAVGTVAYVSRFVQEKLRLVKSSNKSKRKSKTLSAALNKNKKHKKPDADVIVDAVNDAVNDAMNDAVNDAVNDGVNDGIAQEM